MTDKHSQAYELLEALMSRKSFSQLNTMDSNGFKCQFNMPAALKSRGEGDNEYAHGLPPYNVQPCYLVDKYPACPDNWMRSEGKLTSYFVPAEEGAGMWLDFNGNANHAHHLAIVISIQGVNPLTGMPCTDAQMEQYIEECPKHKTKFGPNRYCEKCGFKWPKQNYICTTGTPSGSLWLDGFRAADGVVRQYILTEEKMKGVASNIIGKDRVYAIGISFFLSKDKKPEPPVTEYRDVHHYHSNWYGNWYAGSGTSYPHIYSYFGSPSVDSFDGETLCDSLDMEIKCSNVNDTTKGAIISASAVTPPPGALMKKSATPRAKSRISEDGGSVLRCASLSSAPVRQVKTKKLEVGAGAKIRQAVYDDPEHLDFWHSEPEAILCINYCTKSDVEKIIEQGEIDLEGSKEGFMQDIPVGN